MTKLSDSCSPDPTLPDPDAALRDPRRLAALRRTMLLDTPAEEGFDRLARLAAVTLEAPIACISLLDEDRLFLKSAVGLPEHPEAARAYPISFLFCPYVAALGRPLTVDDAAAHPVFSKHPAARDMGIAAYLGMPLRDQDGHVIGSFCVFDRRPRQWSDQQVQILRDLAAAVMTEIELRTTVREAEAARVEKEQVLRSITDGFYTLDRNWRIRYLNPVAERLFEALTGLSVGELIGRDFWDVMPDGVCGELRHHYDRAVDEQQTKAFEIWCPSACRWFNVHAYPSTAGLAVYVNDITSRREVEQQLQRQAEFRRAVMTSMDDGLYTIDRACRVTSLNPAAERMLGWAEAEVQGRNSHTTFHYQHPDGTTLTPDECPITRVSELSAPLSQFETTFTRKDGTLLPVLVSGSPLYAEGEVAGAVVVFQDITKRRREAELLAGQHRILEMIAEQCPLTEVLGEIARVVERHIPDARCSIVLVDPAGRLRPGAAPSLPDRYHDAVDGLEIGPEAGSCGTAAFLGQAVISSDLTTDPRWASYRSLASEMDFRACWSTPVFSSRGHVIGIFALYYRQAGEPFDTETSLIPMASRLASIAIERITAEDALKESEERYRTLVSNIPGAVYRCECNGDWKMLLLNDFVWEMSGYPAEALIDNQLLAFGDIVHPDDRDRVEAEVREAISSPIPFEVEYRILHADGSIRWIFDKGRPVFSEAGDLLYLDGVLFEITEQKRLETELRLRADELAEADRRKDEFLAMLAHELRNPLAPILNSVQLLRLQHSSPAALDRARDVIERQAHQLRRLVDDLLDVARITRGLVELRRETVLLVDIVRNAVEAVRSNLDERRHSLSVLLPEGPILLEADATRLEQVLNNLLVNAAKFTPHGGEIVLEVERVVLCGGDAGDGVEAVIRVRDTGKGIPPTMIPHIFELFTQVNPSLDRSEGGLGLGLTLVRTLVQMHGGSVVAHSRGLGMGSEFVVRLPALSNEAAGVVIPADVTQSPHSPAIRVLVVDDNVDAAATLAELLEHWGHVACVAHDGPSALEVAREFLPEVVLLDIGLPGMDGYDIAREFRRDGRLCQARLVALTGYGRDVDRLRSREAGVQHHLVKPVDPDLLRYLLESPTLR